MKFIQIQWTCGDINLCKMIASRLIDQKLAACINIIPNVLSLYYWDKKIQEDREFKVYIKTIDRHFEEIATIIKEFGGYDTPEIVSVVIDKIDSKYKEWLQMCLVNRET